MRATSLLLAAHVVIWLAVVAVPAVALVLVGGGARVESDVPGAGGMLAMSVGHAALVALLAVTIGWLPGRCLGRVLRRRGFVPLAAALLVPASVPAYVVFYAWWQSWPPDSALFGWLVDRELIAAARSVTLVAGLACWAWPLVSLCVAVGAAGETPTDDLLDLDGAGPATRLAHRLRRDGAALGVGAWIVFLITFNDTTCFDLANVYSFGFGLRTLEALGAGPQVILRAAAPALALAGAGAISLWILAGRGRPDRAAALRPPRPALMATTAGIWALTLGLPLALFAVRLADPGAVRDFARFYGPPAERTLAVALVVAAAAIVLMVASARQWSLEGRWIRRLGHAVAVGWLLAALVPATLVAEGLEAAYNRDLPLAPSRGNPAEGLGGAVGESEATLAHVVYRRPVILVLGELARVGFVAILVGRWLARREPRSMRDLRRLDAGESLRGFLAASRPALVAGAVATAALAFVLATGEVIVGARVAPPGWDTLAAVVLNDMHYQRPQLVLTALLALLVVAIAAAATVAGAWRALTVRAAAPAVLAAIVGLSGCGPGAGGEDTPLPARDAFGTAGLGLGQFHYPRAIAVDPRTERVYVVDKSARIQRFDFDGEPELSWRMPEWENGKPTGLSVGPDGRVYVADTHYHRIVVYEPDGTEVLRFGRYGEGPGEFIYPTDVAFGSEDRLYVAEYGGHDRIQIFTAEGVYLDEFGAFGSGPGEFSRPQSMVFGDGGRRLYVADACNHRIIVLDPAGRVLGTFGGFGHEPGRFAYPYDLMELDDGTLLVCEFGNNRIQRITADGEPLGTWGRVGRGPGELQYPWGLAGTPRRTFVVDSGNNRVQVMRTPS